MKTHKTHKHAVWVFLASLAFFPLAVGAAGAKSPADSYEWTYDATLYGLAAGMSGDVGIGPVNADLNMGFDKILDNLEFGMMGKIRIAQGRWAFNADVIYMGLGASKNGVSVDFNQWVVEPTASYMICPGFEILAGVRYNNLNCEITGPGVLPAPRYVAGVQSWWDPIIGANLQLPLNKAFNLNFRGDVGGFGIGSELTWQAFPYLGWQFSEKGSIQAGYRWVYNDYETGSGITRFKYDVMSEGPQVGLTWRF